MKRNKMAIKHTLKSASTGLGEVINWPEFQAFMKRLGYEVDKNSDSIRIALDLHGCARVEASVILSCDQGNEDEEYSDSFVKTLGI